MTVYVAVVGPGSEADETCRRIASDVGRLLAERGAVVVTGGLGGVMASAAAGAADAGGMVVGLLPGTDRSDGGDHLTVALPTGLGELRNGLVVRSADVVICVGGSWGTLSEVALAMRTGVPVVCVRGRRVADSSGAELPVPQCESAESAVEIALVQAARGGSG